MATDYILQEAFFYAFAIIGSFSIGYSMLRAGFPSTQAKSMKKRLLYSYVLGLGSSVPAVGAAIYFDTPAAFFVVYACIYAALFALLLTKRVALSQTDTVPLATNQKKKSPQAEGESSAQKPNINVRFQNKNTTGEKMSELQKLRELAKGIIHDKGTTPGSEGTLSSSSTDGTQKTATGKVTDRISFDDSDNPMNRAIKKGDKKGISKKGDKDADGIDDELEELAKEEEYF